MNHDEPDQLWDLLGKARAPKERPFFAAKVLQAVRAEEEHSATTGIAGWWMAFRRRWLLPLAACSAVALAVLLNLPHTPALVEKAGKGGAGKSMAASSKSESTPSDLLMDGLAKGSDNDPDVLAASLDNLVAGQDNALWLQADPSSFYP